MVGAAPETPLFIKIVLYFETVKDCALPLRNINKTCIPFVCHCVSLPADSSISFGHADFSSDPPCFSTPLSGPRAAKEIYKQKKQNKTKNDLHEVQETQTKQFALSTGNNILEKTPKNQKN